MVSTIPLSLPVCDSLRPIDVEFMKHLHGFVNIVPVIAKADTFTIEERDSFKQRIREDLHFHGINIYPSAYGAEDEDDAAANTKIEVFAHFAHKRIFYCALHFPAFNAKIIALCALRKLP